MSVLAEEELTDFGFFGIIKETGVDDLGTVEFQKQYFPHQLYCDKSYEFYRALGDRKVGVTRSIRSRRNPRPSGRFGQGASRRRGPGRSP